MAEPADAWKLKNRVIEVVVQSGGVVFGGAARDKYLHDKHAMDFYRAATGQAYDDRDALPHLFGRWVVPRDVDAYIHADKLAAMIKALEQSFVVKHTFTRDPKKYIPDLDVAEGVLEHRRYRLYPVVAGQAVANLCRGMSCVVRRALQDAIAAMKEAMVELQEALPPILVDVMVSKVPADERQPCAPFGDVDFLCNGLLLDQAGFRITPLLAPVTSCPTRKARLLYDVFDQIERREAVVSKCPQAYRVAKMRGKGWTINCNHAFLVVREARGGASADVCIICHNDLGADDYRLTCCQARYHEECLIQAAEKGPGAMLLTHKCIMCKQSTRGLRGDITILRIVRPAGTGAETPVEPAL